MTTGNVSESRMRATTICVWLHNWPSLALIIWKRVYFLERVIMYRYSVHIVKRFRYVGSQYYRY